MEKISLHSLDVKEERMIFQNNELVPTTIYRLKDGSIFKMFNAEVLNFFRHLVPNFDIEAKVLSADEMKIPEIIIPTKAAYTNGLFTGYVMPAAKGITFTEHDENKTLPERVDLLQYAKEHNELEQIVKRSNNQGIVFPDLCTCENIFIHQDGFSLIDYDGLQIGDHATYSFSTSLGEQDQYDTPKYMNEGLYTPNLDKKSLITLYFSTAFNVNLLAIGKTDPYTGKKITLETIANIICLDDSDFLHKVWQSLQPTGENEYLEYDVFRIADKYNVQISREPVSPNCYLKRLIKK